MELRHQRNPDVLFDCCLPIAGGWGRVVGRGLGTVDDAMSLLSEQTDEHRSQPLAHPSPMPGSPCHAVPQAVYDTIETLLPGAKDRFLELWAAQGSARPGWTQAAFALDGVCT